MDSNEILEKLSECLSQINELSEKVSSLADDYQKSVEAEQAEQIDEAKQAERITNELLDDYFSCFNDSMYYLNENGVVEEVADVYSTSEFDLYPYLDYPNKEYAFQAQKLKKFNDMLLAFKWCYDRDFEPDWGNDDQFKYYIDYSNKSGSFGVRYNVSARFNLVYFSSHEIAQKCADWLNRVADIEGVL